MAPVAVKTTPASYQVLAGQCARKHVLLRCDQNVLPDRPSMRSEKERSSPVGSAGAGAGGGVGGRCGGGGRMAGRHAGPPSSIVWRNGGVRRAAWRKFVCRRKKEQPPAPLPMLIICQTRVSQARLCEAEGVQMASTGSAAVPSKCCFMPAIRNFFWHRNRVKSRWFLLDSELLLAGITRLASTVLWSPQGM
jgi:hypothetical protein